MEQAWEPSSSQERMVAASSKRFILTKEMNHFYEQLMVVVSRSGFDFTPVSATRLWLWGGEQWEQCTGAVCTHGSSPAQL